MKKTVFGILFSLGSAWALAQGPLMPPGAPGETMKTLDQVEPRVPISSAPVTIDAPGSYYLTTNLTDTVVIRSDDVALDLMGFAITSAFEAVDFPGNQSNVVVRNGTIRGSSTGLDGRTLVDASCLFEGLRVYDTQIGIYVGSGCTVRDCEVWNSSTWGIRVVGDGNSQVTGCRVYNNPGIGLSVMGSGTLVENNMVRGNGDNYDIAQGNLLNLLLCEIPETLDWPCSVKLAGSLSASQPGVTGITVNADNVTIDLAGHTLIGPGASSGSGLYQASTFRNLTVLNGQAVNWRGVAHAGFSCSGWGNRLSGVQACSNAYGIILNGGSSMLEDCQAQHNLNIGVYIGSGNTMVRCAAYRNGEDGIYALHGNTLEACTVSYNGGSGIYAYEANTLEDCAASGNSGDGVDALYGNTLGRCTANNNGGDGIYASEANTLEKLYVAQQRR